MDANSSTSSLGKLLPKAITSKRRRRKEKLAHDSDDDRRLSRRESSLESGDDANSSYLTGDDGDRDRDRDNASFGSRASSLAPDTTDS